MKAHPSFVRERHLETMLVEAGLICARSTSADQDHGVDLVAIRGRYALRLCTYIGTTNARVWRARKLGRRPTKANKTVWDDAVFLELPLDPGEEYRVGPYRLYGLWHARAIAEYIGKLHLENPGHRILRVPAPYMQEPLPRRTTESDEDLPF